MFDLQYDTGHLISKSSVKLYEKYMHVLLNVKTENLIDETWDCMCNIYDRISQVIYSTLQNN